MSLRIFCIKWFNKCNFDGIVVGNTGSAHIFILKTYCTFTYIYLKNNEDTHIHTNLRKHSHFAPVEAS